MNFLGTGLSSLFTYRWWGGTEGSFLQPEVFMILTWTVGEVYLWHFTLCCHVPALWLWNTERWRREALWATQLQSIREETIPNKMQQYKWFIVNSRCWLLTTVATGFGHLYAHHQAKRPRVTAYGVYLLVVLDVAGCGAVVLRCRVWALWRLL